MKKQFFAKLISMLLIAVMAISLTACKKESTNQTDNKSEQKTTADSSEKKTSEKETVESAKPKFNGKVVLGATAPLTGPNQMTGTYYVNGMKLAVEEINAAGGILGKELVLDVQDEGADQSVAVNATIKLIESGVPAIIGSYFSTNCMAVLPEIEKAGVVYFANGSNPDIAAQNNPYVWQIRVTDDFTGSIMANVAIESLKMKNPAVLYTTAASTTILKDRFVEAMKDRGVAVKDSLIFGAPENETNFNSVINQILASDADGLVVMGVSEAWDVPFAQQLVAAGNTLPLLGSLSFSSAPFIEAAGAAADKWNTVSDWSPNILEVEGLDVPEQAISFEKKYREKYGMMSASQSAWGYDCVYLFKEACEKAGTTEDREAINKAMGQTDFQGANNYYKVYDSPWHVLSTYMLVCETKDGKTIPWQKISIRN